MHTFNKSLSSGIFPAIWKHYIMPILKSGDRSLITNYPPISKLSALPKLFEKLWEPIIYSTLEHITINEQHDFCKSKLTDINLTTFYSYLIDMFYDNQPSGAIYTDIKKAFDTVNIIILIKS